MIQGPACAHSHVRHVTVKNTDGTCRDEWWCRDCEGGTQFVPVRECPHKHSVWVRGDSENPDSDRVWCHDCHGFVTGGTEPPPADEPARGVRHNKGKVRWHLVPWDGMQAVADIFEKGAELYSPRNWEKGLSYSEVFDSLQRHLLSWYKGENRDAKSGMLHLAHVTWNALALLTFTVRGRTDLDDRPNKVEATSWAFRLGRGPWYWGVRSAWSREQAIEYGRRYCGYVNNPSDVLLVAPFQADPRLKRHVGIPDAASVDANNSEQVELGQ